MSLAEELKNLINTADFTDVAITEEWVVFDFNELQAGGYIIYYYSYTRKKAGTERISPMRVPKVAEVVELIRQGKVPRVKVGINASYLIANMEIVRENVKEEVREYAKKYVITENGFVCLEADMRTCYPLPNTYIGRKLKYEYVGEKVDLVVIPRKNSRNRVFAVIPFIDFGVREEEDVDEDAKMILEALSGEGEGGSEGESSEGDEGDVAEKVFEEVTKRVNEIRERYRDKKHIIKLIQKVLGRGELDYEDERKRYADVGIDLSVVLNDLESDGILAVKDGKVVLHDDFARLVSECSEYDSKCREEIIELLGG